MPLSLSLYIKLGIGEKESKDDMPFGDIIILPLISIARRLKLSSSSFFQLKNDYEHHHHYPDVAPNYKRIFPVKNSEKFMSFQPLHLVCVLSSPFKSKLSSSSWFCFYLRLYPATLSDTKSENVRGGAKSLHFVIMIIFTCCKERYLIFVIIIITISLLSLVSCCHFHSVISQAHEKLFSAVC